MKYLNRMFNGLEATIVAVVGFCAIGGFIYWADIRDNVRDRAFKYLVEAGRLEYCQKVEDCTVTLSTGQRLLKLTIENSKGTKIRLLNYKDIYSVFSSGKFRGIDFMAIDDGKYINANNVSKELIKPYERMMDEKLKALEPSLKDLVAESKLSLEAQKKADKAEATNILKKHVDSLSDLCSEQEH